MNNKNKLNRYTIGGFGDDGDWIDNTLRVKVLEEADIIILPGGVDISATIYGELPGIYTQIPSFKRDKEEISALNYIFNEGGIGVGICRGLS